MHQHDRFALADLVDETLHTRRRRTRGRARGGSAIARLACLRLRLICVPLEASESNSVVGIGSRSSAVVASSRCAVSFSRTSRPVPSGSTRNSVIDALPIDMIRPNSAAGMPEQVAGRQANAAAVRHGDDRLVLPLRAASSEIAPPTRTIASA